jgi:Tfp pilus assembly protein PilX
MMRNAHQCRNRPTSHRRGAVLIVLLAVFAVTMALAGLWARRIVSEHRLAHRVAQRAQAQWLAEAGVRRAAAQLTADPNFTGEEWSIAADDLGQSYSALVVLSIEPVADAPGSYRITAEARCPEQKPRVRITKTVAFTPPNSEPAP